MSAPGANQSVWSIDRLKPYDGNARTHSDAQIDQIVASIQEWGFTVPVLIDSEGGIIAGHGRWLAAKKIGLQEVPVVIAPEDWTDAQKRAYVIVDNKLSLNSGWDTYQLGNELDALREMDFDIKLAGFDDKELDALFAVEDLQDDADTGRKYDEPGAPKDPAIVCPKCGCRFLK